MRQKKLLTLLNIWHKIKMFWRQVFALNLIALNNHIQSFYSWYIFQELLTEEPLLFKKVLDKIKNPDKDCQRIVSGPEKTRNGPAAAKNVPDAEDISGNIFIRNNDELNSSLLSDSGRWDVTQYDVMPLNLNKYITTRCL